MQAETSVKYNREIWHAIQCVREELECPEREPSDSANARDHDPDLTDALMWLCMLVVMQDTSRISLYDSPMMHYLAVQGVDKQSRTLKPSFHYTPILAGMLWVNWLIMLEVAVPLEAWPAVTLKSRAEVDSVRDRIHELQQKHLCKGSFSPTASILS
jgi:hypothetical protein